MLSNHLHILKVKWSRYRPGRGIALLFHDRGTRRGWVVSSTPRRTLPPGKTRYPFYRRLGGPQGRSRRAENLVPTGTRSRTVQPVVSRYTDWATRPTHTHTHTHTQIYIYLFICASGATLYYSSKPPAGGHSCILVSSPLKWWRLQLRRL